MDAQEVVSGWEALGARCSLVDHEIFVIDVGPDEPSSSPPLLVLHGFPTSSIDFSQVLPALRRRRRVVLFDFLGFGLSDKPDGAYSLFDQADLVEAVARHRSLDRVDLLTHDMGDSVGGEVLARSLDDYLPFEIARRVLTNGSVYIGMAQLTDGQKMLLSLPAERIPDGLGLDAPAMAAALRGTLSVSGDGGNDHLLASAELVIRDGGAEILPLLIRYVEERHAHEDRWTGAIERHPAPLRVVWGADDPIAVVAMTERLAQRRPDADVVRLEGVGHYPMLEAPGRFAREVLAGLS